MPEYKIQFQGKNLMPVFKTERSARMYRNKVIKQYLKQVPGGNKKYSISDKMGKPIKRKRGVMKEYLTGLQNAFVIVGHVTRLRKKPNPENRHISGTL